MIHEGTNSGDEGHFFAFLKIEDQWMEFNDEKIVVWEEKKMLEASFGRGDNTQEDKTHACKGL
jgi:hypothetical protein